MYAYITRCRHQMQSLALSTEVALECPRRATYVRTTFAVISSPYVLVTNGIYKETERSAAAQSTALPRAVPHDVAFASPFIATCVFTSTHAILSFKLRHMLIIVLPSMSL